MSEKFYEKFLSLFSGFILLLILFLTAIMVLLGYFSTQNMILYYGYCAILVFSAFYGIWYCLEFRHFKENLYLFIPSENAETETIEPLNMEVEDLPLRVCLFYRNGVRFSLIQEFLGLKHPQQVKRELIKGLDILLRSYEKHEGKVEA